MTQARSLLRVRLLAAICSFPLLAAVIVSLLRWEMPHSQGLAATLAACFALGLVFGFARPRGGWALGLWTSAAFWLYFGFVFVALAAGSELDWTPLLEALAALVVGCVGAFSGSRLNRFSAT